MSFFIASIVSSTLIFLAFKLFPRFGVNRFQAIVVNYWTAFSFGYLLSDKSAWTGLLDKEWIHLVPIEGILFISLFNVMALTVQHHGVSIGSIASRTAMIIPAVMIIILDPLETFSLSKIAAVGLACFAVILCTGKADGKAMESRYIYLPIILFVGSGLIDFGIGYVEHFLITDPADGLVFIPSIFFVAACIGTGIAVWRYAKDKSERFARNDIIGGVLLGIINYASLYFIIKAMETHLISASLFFPVNNLGIVIAGVLMGAFLFSEKLSKKNRYGILLGLLSILLMIFIAE
jgi:multidrug transporter EmrE-like cation transporter